MASPLRVLVTGAAGQIAYSLVMNVAKGDVFGPEQPVILHLLEIPVAEAALHGVVMELEDCALPLLRGVVATVDTKTAFTDIDVALLVGAMPRREGMDRKDLLGANVKIFKVQGEALDNFAKKTVKVVVVGNPANTNAYIASKYAPSIPKENFSALTRLDHNRAKAQIASRLGVPCNNVKRCIIWGNHSNTQFPDVRHATVKMLDGTEKPAMAAVADDQWIKTEFLKTVATRGAAIIAARKLSSAMSAAKAICDHIKDWFHGTAEGDWVSMAVMSDGSYNTPKDVIFSFPVTIKDGKWTIVQGLNIDDWSTEKLETTAKELVEEKELALEQCT